MEATTTGSWCVYILHNRHVSIIQRFESDTFHSEERILLYEKPK